MSQTQVTLRPSIHTSYGTRVRRRQSSHLRPSSFGDKLEHWISHLSIKALNFKKKYDRTKRQADSDTSRLAIFIHLLTEEVKKGLGEQERLYPEKHELRYRSCSRNRWSSPPQTRSIRSQYVELERDHTDSHRLRRTRSSEFFRSPHREPYDWVEHDAPLPDECSQTVDIDGKQRYSPHVNRGVPVSCRQADVDDQRPRQRPTAGSASFYEYRSRTAGVLPSPRQTFAERKANLVQKTTYTHDIVRESADRALFPVPLPKDMSRECSGQPRSARPCAATPLDDMVLSSTLIHPRVKQDLGDIPARPGYGRPGQESFYLGSPARVSDDLITHDGGPATSTPSRARSPTPTRGAASRNRGRSTLDLRRSSERGKSPGPFKNFRASGTSRNRHRFPPSIWPTGRMTRSNPSTPHILISCFPTVAPTDRPSKRSVSFLLWNPDGTISQKRPERWSTGQRDDEILLSQREGGRSVRDLLYACQEENEKRAMCERTAPPPWHGAGQGGSTGATAPVEARPGGGDNRLYRGRNGTAQCSPSRLHYFLGDRGSDRKRGSTRRH